MESVGLQDHGDGDEKHGSSTRDWESLLSELQELQDRRNNMSYAELNAKRKQKTFSAFRDPGISAKVDIVETLIRPNIDLMDRLFLRSKAIGQLHHIPQDDHDTRHELMERRAQSEKNSKC